MLFFMHCQDFYVVFYALSRLFMLFVMHSQDFFFMLFVIIYKKELKEPGRAITSNPDDKSRVKP